MWRLDDWLCKSCFLRRRRPWEFGEGGVVWARYGNEDEWWPAKILSLPQRGDSYETSTFEVTLIGKNWTGIVDYACIVPFTDTLYHGVTLDRKLEECIELAFVERQVRNLPFFFLEFFLKPKLKETRKSSGCSL